MSYRMIPDNDRSDSEDSVKPIDDYAEADRDEDLVHIPFSERIKLEQKNSQHKSAGAIKIPGETQERSHQSYNQDENRDREFKVKYSKDAPDEMSSNKEVSWFRRVIDVRNPKMGDPRFKKNTGDFRPDIARHNYGFLKEYRKKELVELTASLKKAKSDSEKQEIKKAIQSLSSKLQTEEDNEKMERIRHDFKKAQKGRNTGSVFHLKKSEQKRLFREQKFQELKSDKAIEKALARRRKKIAEKEKKNLPRIRRS